MPPCSSAARQLHRTKRDRHHVVARGQADQYKLRPSSNQNIDQVAYFAKYVPVTSATPPSSQPTLWRTCRVWLTASACNYSPVERQPNQTVSTVAGHMRLSLPAASQYLRALEARGLLTCRRVERRAEYRLSAATPENAAGEILRALRLVFRGRAQPIKAFQTGDGLYPSAADRACFAP